MDENSAFSNHEVSAVLKKLVSALEQESKRIFTVVKKAADDRDSATAAEAIDFARKLEGFKSEVEKSVEAWNALRKEMDAASPGVRKIVDGNGQLLGGRAGKAVPGHSRKVDHPLAPKTNFTVTFADGNKIERSHACDVFTAAIEHIGAKRVQKLNLLSCGEPLVSNALSGKYPAASKPTADGFYVLTQSSTEAKIKYLKDIARRLGIKLKIEQKMEQ